MTSTPVSRGPGRTHSRFSPDVNSREHLATVLFRHRMHSSGFDSRFGRSLPRYSIFIGAGTSTGM